MKSRFTTLLFSLLFSVNLFSQLPDGSIAPNITFTDIDGNTHTLYDILDEGKSVVFDVMATWCGPCWNYHNTGTLEALYEEYGPVGTNEIEIFMVESSASTNEACLYGPSGCSGGTYGDWTAGTLYPIVHITSGNGGTFNSDFNINYFPTLYKICPNRKIYEVGQPPLSTWENWVTSCNLDATEEITNVICYDEGQSMIDLTTDGGYGNISYSWSNGANTEDLVGVPAGDYSCTITEGQGHSIEIGPFSIDGPSSPLTVNIVSQSNVNCAGNNNGFILTSSSGGGDNYTYLWNTGANTQNLNNISGGLYTLSVTDSYGCTETVTAGITEPPLLTLSTQPINENCDQGDGSILLFANGGQGSYLFDIGNGPTPENIINDLSSGTYSATVTDENGCTSLSAVTIENVPGPIAEAGSPEFISCSQENINLNGSGSSSGNDITYSWETFDGNIVSGANTLSPVVDEAGTYTLTVLNFLTGCQNTDDVIVEGDLNTPESEAGEDTTLTCIMETTTLDGSNSSQGNDIDYQWLNEDGDEISIEVTVDTDQPGTYELIVTNTSNGCTSNSFVVISQDIEAPNAEIGEANEITCSTTSVNLDGSASSEGSQFEYQWLNESGEEISTNIDVDVDEPGTYELIVTNTDNGCTQSASVEVAQDIEEPTANAGDNDEITCATTSVNLDGSASSEGSQFEHQWLNESGEEISSNIDVDVDEPGTYELIVTNTDNGCSQSASVEVAQDIEEPTANAGDNDEITCATTSVNLDGSASSEGSQFEYQWLNESGVEISSNIDVDVDEPGTYELIVTNTDNGCTQSSSVEVAQDIEEPTANAGDNDEITCATTSVNLDGSASSQGSQFEYQWLNESGEEISSNVDVDVDEPGTYELIVTNTDNGCSQSASVIVDQNIEEPTANAGDNDEITCTTTSVNLDGSASSQGSQFEYQWLNENGNEISSNINVDVDEPGTYELIVTNSDNGCSHSASVEVAQNTELPTANAGDNDQITCVTTSVNLDGSASSQGSQFDYQWLNSNGVQIGIDINVQVDESGTYELIVTNTDNGCSQSASVEVAQNTELPTANAGDNDQITCVAISVNLDGSASSEGSQFEYQWLDSNGVQIGTDINVEVDQPDTYELIVTNTDNGCSQSASVEIGQNIEAPQSDAGPNGQLDCQSSSIELNGSNSSTGPEFEYGWFNSNNTNIGNTISIDVSAAEIYTLVVTNTQNGCTSSSQAEVTASTDFPEVEVAANGVLNCVNDIVMINGNGSSEGSDFNYQWLDASNDEIGNDLSVEVNTPGTYTFIVSNTTNGCSASSTVLIEEDVAAPVINITDPDILDCISTSVNLDASNSTSNGQLAFEWMNSNGNSIGSGEFIEVSNAGIYTLVVTNTDNGCSTMKQVQVEASNDIPVASAETDGILTCSTGTVNISGVNSSANGIISYSWQDVNQNEIGTTEIINISNPGTYTLIITDQDNGCSAQTSIDVQQDIESPTAQAVVNGQLNCNLSELTLDGSGSSSASNITYSWTTQNGNIIGNPNIQSPLVNTSGNYNLVVTNTTNGCTSSAAVEVSELSEPVLSLNSTNNVACFNGTDGSASLNINGGAAPYTYNWSNGASGLDINNLAAGVYTLTATDAVGCEDHFEITIVQPEELIIQVEETTHNICPNDTAGSIDISASGGSGGYTYLWSNGLMTADIDNLESGMYSVIITDQAGCEKTEVIEITSADVLPPTAIAQDVIVSLDQNGTAIINTNMVDNGSSDNCGLAALELDIEFFDCSNIGQNQVTLMVTDLAGNTMSESATVTVIDDISPTISCVENIVSNSCQGVEYALPSVVDNCGAIEPVLIEGLPSGSVFPEGETMITYLVEDFSGNTATCSFSITVENTLESAFDFGHVSCFEESDGSITALPTGGIPGYTFLWSNGATTQNVSNLAAGEYSVIITDEVGCQFEQIITIEEPEVIEIVVDNVVNEMENGSNGSIEVSISGGTPGYNYQWTDINGQVVSNEEDLLNVPAGEYTLTVSDINGCTLSSETFVVDNIVAVTNLDFEKHILISPNPTSGDVVINIELDKSRTVELAIADVTGRVLLGWNAENISVKTYQVSLADFPNGVYLTRVIIDGEAYVQKLVLVKK